MTASLRLTTSWDDGHPLEQILEAFENARQPKELVLLDMSLIEAYGGEGQNVALAHAVAFFDRYLRVSSNRGV